MPRSLLIKLFFTLWLVQSLPLAARDETTPSEQTQRVLKELCEKGGCAFDVRVLLKQKDGPQFDKTFPILPVVQPYAVSVYAGQSVLFEADIHGDQLTNLKLVKSAVHPEKTLSVSLEQNSDNSMRLILTNPFKKNLKISMNILRLDNPNLLRTSSCPVLSGKFGIEQWPYPIFQVVLGNMRLLDDSNEMSCSE